MPVYLLSQALTFPSPEDADEDGLLAIGGDLSLERLVLAYSMGVFPWYSENDPIMWWSPDPRMVIEPETFKPSRSLKKLQAKGHYRISMDEAFEAVIQNCSHISRREQDGTWITNEMTKAYVSLHHYGVAHSIECWDDDKLVGGLYGLSFGDCFFGESMFSKQSNVSKLAFWALMDYTQAVGITFVDCQLHNEHLESLGASAIPRSDFLQRLYKDVQAETRMGVWTDEFTIRCSLCRGD